MASGSLAAGSPDGADQHGVPGEQLVEVGRLDGVVMVPMTATMISSPISADSGAGSRRWPPGTGYRAA
jgi:hypothetical protein